MHNSFIVPGIDGAVVRRQAWERLTDYRGLKEASLVHDHPFVNGITYDEDKSNCSGACLIYHVCATDGKPHNHAWLLHSCPDWKVESNA